MNMNEFTYLDKDSADCIQVDAVGWRHSDAILRRHSDLFWAATSTSSQVIPIHNKSLLNVLL